MSGRAPMVGTVPRPVRVAPDANGSRIGLAPYSGMPSAIRCDAGGSDIDSTPFRSSGASLSYPAMMSEPVTFSTKSSDGSISTPNVNRSPFYERVRISAFSHPWAVRRHGVAVACHAAPRSPHAVPHRPSSSSKSPASHARRRSARGTRRRLPCVPSGRPSRYASYGLRFRWPFLMERPMAFRALAGLAPASMLLGLVGQCGYHVHRFGIRRALADYCRHGRRVDDVVGERHQPYRDIALGRRYVAGRGRWGRFVPACRHVLDECLLFRCYLLG